MTVRFPSLDEYPLDELYRMSDSVSNALARMELAGETGTDAYQRLETAFTQVEAEIATRPPAPAPWHKSG